MKGPRRNRFTAGIVIGSEGGYFVVAEKRPRPAAARPLRGVPVWEDVIAIVAAERLTGRMTDMLDDVATFLRGEELAGDCIALVDTAGLGDTLGRLLADRAAGAGLVIVGNEERERFDPTAGAWLLGFATLQARFALLFEARRLLVVEEVENGAALLRSLERLDALPSSGATRDLAIATAIAAWAAERSPSDGPWASAKPPPEGSAEAGFFEEKDALAELDKEERDAVRQSPRRPRRLRR